MRKVLHSYAQIQCQWLILWNIRSIFKQWTETEKENKPFDPKSFFMPASALIYPKREAQNETYPLFIIYVASLLKHVQFLLSLL